MVILGYMNDLILENMESLVRYFSCGGHNKFCYQKPWVLFSDIQSRVLFYAPPHRCYSEEFIIDDRSSSFFIQICSTSHRRHLFVPFLPAFSWFLLARNFFFNSCSGSFQKTNKRFILYVAFMVQLQMTKPSQFSVHLSLECKII